jgi:uracil DNA glycosylase
LNTCLTVKPNTAGSHSNKGWEEFTDKVVDVIDKYGGANLAAPGSGLAGRSRGIVFLAWGAWAAKRVAKLSKVSRFFFLFYSRSHIRSLHIDAYVEQTPHTVQRCAY